MERRIHDGITQLLRLDQRRNSQFAIKRCFEQVVLA